MITRKKSAQSKILCRQGDVGIIIPDAPIEVAGLKEIPRERGSVVLAHGEVTGHSHRIDAKHVSLLAMEDDRMSGTDAIAAIARLGGGLIPDAALQVKGEPASLLHEEHSTVVIPKGTYIRRIQEEYSPEELRSVQD